jgi:hypothetical protein
VLVNDADFRNADFIVDAGTFFLADGSISYIVNVLERIFSRSSEANCSTGTDPRSPLVC